VSVERKRPRTVENIVFGLVIALCVYGVCYIQCPTFDSGPAAPIRTRVYQNKPVARLFLPAAWVEAKLSRKRIAVGWEQSGAGIGIPDMTIYYLAEP